MKKRIKSSWMIWILFLWAAVSMAAEDPIHGSFLTKDWIIAALLGAMNFLVLYLVADLRGSAKDALKMSVQNKTDVAKLSGRVDVVEGICKERHGPGRRAEDFDRWIHGEKA